jgi:hypothetical protein
MKEKKMSSNVYLYHQKLISKLRQSFIHLDSQLKSYIQFYYNKRRRKESKDKEEEIDKKQAVITCLIDQDTFSKIYRSILQKSIDQCQYEVEHFRSHCHFQFDLDQSFWKRCWCTFTQKIAMEPNVLSGKRCQGNRVMELWIESFFDHFWITIQHPIEMDRTRTYSPNRSDRSSLSSKSHGSRSSRSSSNAGSSYQYERHKQKVEPMRISLHNNHHHHHQNHPGEKSRRPKKVESDDDDNDDRDDYDHGL